MYLFRTAVAAVSLVCLLPLTAMADDSKADKAPVTHAEFNDMLKQALSDHPEIIADALTKMRMKQQADAQKQAAAGLEARKKDLYDPAAPAAGNLKSPDITIVEFFDYHCGYCKRMYATLAKLIEEDKDVKVIFMEFPILSEDSVQASRAALAVNRIAKDKYFAYHSELIKFNGKYDETNLLDMAKKVGVNPDKLKAEMAKPEITAILDKNRDLGQALGIHGTPALIVGDNFTPGAMQYDDLVKMIAEARKNNKAAPASEPSPKEKPKARAKAKDADADKDADKKDDDSAKDSDKKSDDASDAPKDSE